MTEMVFRPGDLVESRCGRDAGCLLFVVSVQDGFLMLCDGRMRRTEHPKRKKPKHVRHVPLREPFGGDSAESLIKTMEKLRSGVPVTNSELRRALNALTDAGFGNGSNVRRDADVKG